MTTWRNCIVGHRDVDPRELKANERNWRLHPPSQARALREVLESVGVVQGVLYNVTTQRLVDGHLRVEQAIETGQQLVPVTDVELTEEEEALILTTLDPLAGLATADSARLDELLRSVQVETPELQNVLDDLSKLCAPGGVLDLVGASGDDVGGFASGGAYEEGKGTVTIKLTEEQSNDTRLKEDLASFCTRWRLTYKIRS